MTAPVHLTRIRPELNEWRFYRLDIWPDLYCGFSVVREWGRIGQDGQCRHDPYPTEADAYAAAEKLANAKQRRGYRDTAHPGGTGL
jgi:predicted DNA-binding WGR domain protein